jgi:uncharacterized membrane protein
MNMTSEAEHSQQSAKNVGTAERWASAAIGACLVARGMKRASLGGLLLAGAGGALMVRGATGFCSLYAALGWNTARKIHPANRSKHIEKSILVSRPAAEAYQFWRNPVNLKAMFPDVESIEAEGDRISHWTFSGPAGAPLSWTAEIINDVPNELIAWQTLPGASVYHAGSVHFIPQPSGGAEIRIVMDYRPPLGHAGHKLATMLGRHPAKYLDEGLLRIKNELEACGEEQARPEALAQYMHQD